MDKKFCDLCKREIIKIDRVYFISYGEKGRMFSGNKKSGEICRDCCLKIGDFVETIRT